MSWGCIKKNFDLFITYTDCKHIVIEDQSRWMTDIGYDKPETIDVVIRLDNRGLEVTKPIYTERRNILTTIDLFGTTEEQCFVDDIYCFIVESCGLTYTISRAYLCNTLCKIDQLVARSPDDRSLDNLRVQAQAIEINARLGKTQTASELFKSLNKKLENITCNHCS